MKYILYKGFIGIDGISLTVGEVTATRFCVHLIPETLQRTTLGAKNWAIASILRLIRRPRRLSIRSNACWPRKRWRLRSMKPEKNPRR